MLTFSLPMRGGVLFSARHCSDQSIGRSVRRLMQNPRGRRPSFAAFAKTGEMNARDSIIRIERSLVPS